MTSIRYIGVDFTFGLGPIVFFITRISLYRGSVPYIVLQLWPGWRISFVIPRTSLCRGLLNRGSTVYGPLRWTELICGFEKILSGKPFWR